MALSRDWEARIDRFIDVLRQRVVTARTPMKARLALTTEHLSPEQAAGLKFKEVAPGAAWGAKWEYGWFQAAGRAPAVAKGNRLALLAEVGHPHVETIVFRAGRAVAGIDRWHDHVDVTDLIRPGERLEVLMESYAGHGPTPVGAAFVPPGLSPIPPTPARQQRFAGIFLAEWNEPAFQLWIDAATLRRLAKALDADSLRRHKLEAALCALSCAVDLEADEDAFRAALPAARRLAAPLLAARNGSTAPEFYCFGHSHIDVAWLWPLAQTYRKSAHTFSTALELMGRYKEYRFLQSQAQLYAFLRGQYPEIYRRIKQAARRGQWIADGAMWVEPDTNVAGGEALIRQFLLGKRFFRDEFNVESRVCWLPDVFGYSGNLPQIMAGCGVRYFSTQKIYWNYYGGTTFPYETFTWEGIDGSTVLAHLHRDYNAQAHPEALAARWKQCVSKHSTERLLFPFGWGDGGGGPTREHLEFLRREKDLEGLPRTHFADLNEFFADLEKAGPPADRWVGELYLEVHRGTYTSQAQTKRGNRKGELALREAELWSALAWMLAGRKYPAQNLEDNWKKVLLNQFHDILPGSSIGRVYQEAEELYEEVLTDTAELASAGRRALAAEGGTGSGGTGLHPVHAATGQVGNLSHQSGGTGFQPVREVTVFNSLSWARDALVLLPNDGVPVDSAGRALPTQPVKIGKQKMLLVELPQVPSCGAKLVRLVEERPAEEVAVTRPMGAAAAARGTHFILENQHLRLRVDRAGQIAELLDKDADRQLVPAGRAMNRLEMYRDNPANWDAWDIDYPYTCTPVNLEPAATVRVAAAGPLEARLAVRRTLGRSKLDQQIVLRAGSRRVDFETVIDWRESHRVLKAAFPADLTAPELRSEIAFGHVRRPTNRNTEFERQRFEWPAHKWADLSEAGCGISLLNDCKYGYDCLDGVLKLTLLRAPVLPDPSADRRRHELVYSLYVHNTPFAAGQTVRQAYELNVPVSVEPLCRQEGSLVEIWDPAIILETLKRSEDGRALVLRLYESLGSSARAVVELGTPIAMNGDRGPLPRPIRRADQCDMLENPQRKLRVSGTMIRLDFRPFEIKTIRVEL